MLWQRLRLSTSTLPGAPCEVNLSSEARDALQYTYMTTPPPPKTLGSAVTRIHQLDGRLHLPSVLE
jgi:hypothetical protein